MVCKICGQSSASIFRRTILQKYDVEYFQCSSCGFIQTEEPYWLEEAYRSPITTEDTGIIRRNILLAKRTTVVLFWLFDAQGNFLDDGGGYGLFVRMMRDRGFNFSWSDPYTENLFARGFEFDRERGMNIDLVTSFECFEHFVHPLQEIERMFSIAPSILFSTEPFADGTPDPDRWKYYYFSHGQHISLFSLSSLRFIARTYHKHFYSNKKSFHLFTDRPLNNATFNMLLKMSLLGLSPLTGLLMKSRTKADSAAFGQIRNTKNENVP